MLIWILMLIIILINPYNLVLHSIIYIYCISVWVWLKNLSLTTHVGQPSPGQTCPAWSGANHLFRRYGHWGDPSVAPVPAVESISKKIFMWRWDKIVIFRYSPTFFVGVNWSPNDQILGSIPMVPEKISTFWCWDPKLVAVITYLKVGYGSPHPKKK